MTTQLDSGPFLDALAKRLGEKGAPLTDGGLARRLGVTAAAVSQWRVRGVLSNRQIGDLVARVERASAQTTEATAIKPIVEFYPIDRCRSAQKAKWELFSVKGEQEDRLYRVGLREALRTKTGIYVFHDSRGRALYTGQAKAQSLWDEMKSVFNRDRAVQLLRLVSHPVTQREFKTSAEKERQIRSRQVELYDMAAYFSAYEVADGMIAPLEALLIRAFPNDLLNIKMEKIRWTSPKLGKRSKDSAK